MERGRQIAKVHDAFDKVPTHRGPMVVIHCAAMEFHCLQVLSRIRCLGTGISPGTFGGGTGAMGMGFPRAPLSLFPVNVGSVNLKRQV